jgi:hypothetical protein
MNDVERWLPSDNLRASIAQVVEMFAANQAAQMETTVQFLKAQMLPSAAVAVQALSEHLGRMELQVRPSMVAVQHLSATLRGSVLPDVQSMLSALSSTPAQQFSQSQLLLTQLRMLDLRKVMLETSPEGADAPATPLENTALVPERQWGISAEAATKIVHFLRDSTAGVAAIDTLIRELVGDEPSPWQVLYWSAGIAAMVLVLVLLSRAPGQLPGDGPGSN